jgi:hypothetical protein
MHTSTILTTANFIQALATSLIAITAIVTAIIALNSLRLQNAIRLGEANDSRGRWLTELFQLFVTTPPFEEIRCQLYRREKSNLAAALKRSKKLPLGRHLPFNSSISAEDARLLEKLDSYLDFMGLIERLIVNGELQEEDAYRLWSWYALESIGFAPVLEIVERDFEWVAALRARFARIKEEHEVNRQQSSRFTRDISSERTSADLK